MQKLDDSNFLLYAAANYVNAQCYDSEEFFDDLKRYKYLKRLYYRYREKGELKERLILNHLITLYNVFDYQANTRMLFYKCDRNHWDILKTFLIYMGRMPDQIENIGDYGTVYTQEIGVDLRVANILREL